MKKIFVIGIICLLILSGFALLINNYMKTQDEQLNPIWYKTYNNNIFSIAIKDSYIYTAGSITYNNGNSSIALVSKLDLNGDVIWNRTWNDSRYCYAFSLALDESNIYVSGSELYEKNAFILKYDLNGNELWNRTVTIEGCRDTNIRSVIVDNTGIYFAGRAWDTKMCAFILKYDKMGNQLWNRTWNNILESADYFVLKSQSYIYAGGTICNDTGGCDGLILKYDSNGKLIWNRKYAQCSFYGGASDGSYYYITGSGYNGVLLRKYDLNDNLIWDKRWKGSTGDRGSSIAFHDTSIYVCVITTDVMTGTESYARILRYDKEGNLIWNKYWGIGTWDKSYSIVADNSGLYVMGWTINHHTQQGASVLFKTNFDGEGGPLKAPEWLNIETVGGIIGVVAIFIIAFIIFKRRKKRESAPSQPVQTQNESLPTKLE